MAFYSPSRKEHFIQTTKESYVKAYQNLFNVSASIEEKYHKDLYEFELDEIQELFVKLESKSIKTSGHRFNLLTLYFNTYMHLRKDKRNPLHTLTQKWANQFVVSNRRIISENDLEEIMTRIPNAQDKVVYRLIFEGVNGTSYSELLNLKVTDVIRETNTLRLNDPEKGSREIKVTDRCMTLIKEAINQTKYIREEGKTQHTEFFDLDYVIRRTGSHIGENRSMQIITTKINIFKKAANNNDLTVHIIFYSGIARKAIDLSREKNKPVRKLGFGPVWKEIATQFNEIPKKHGPEGKQSYYYNLWNNIDVELVHELYGELEDYRIEDYELVNENEAEQQEAKRKRRIESDKFRELAMDAYNTTCAVTGETLRDVLEACHIQPYINKKSNHIQNSIILRADIHKLFDSGYLTIDEDYIIHVSKIFDSKYYQKFNDKKIHLPSDPLFHPSRKALKHNMEIFRDYIAKEPQLV